MLRVRSSDKLREEASSHRTSLHEVCSVRSDTTDLLVLILSISFLIAFAIGLGGGACLRSSAERDCLSHGYASAKVPWAGWGKPYCIKRLDQTDIVVPLDQVNK
jgi:hypothetical protein